MGPEDSLSFILFCNWGYRFTKNKFYVSDDRGGGKNLIPVIAGTTTPFWYMLTVQKIGTLIINILRSTNFKERLL